MPGAMHKMGVYLGLVEDDEDAVGDGSGHDSYDRGPPRAASDYGCPISRTRAATVAHRACSASTQPDDRAGLRADYAEAEYPSYRITTLHPRTYNEARTIGEHFRSAPR